MLAHCDAGKNAGGVHFITQVGRRQSRRRLAQTLAMARLALFLMALGLCSVALAMKIAPHWKTLEFEVTGGYIVSIEVGDDEYVKSLHIHGRKTNFEIPPEDYQNIRKPLLSGVELTQSGDRHWTVEVPFLPEGASFFHCAWAFQFMGADYVGVVLTRRSTVEALQSNINCGPSRSQRTHG
jgi:hypothetical protein